jgi:hypothetical protein
MSGLTASVLLRSAFTAVDSSRVTQLLRDLTEHVVETRKGRHWQFTVKNAVASLSVLSTLEHDYDFEDQLLAHDLLFDDAPDAFVLSFGTRRDCDRAVCSRIAAELADLFEGIDCGFSE